MTENEKCLSAEKRKQKIRERYRGVDKNEIEVIPARAIMSLNEDTSHKCEGLEDVVYIHMMFNRELKRIVVEGCDENDKDALRWCIAKPDKRKSRKMVGKPFSELVYREMGWDENCRYKILGYRIQFEGKTLYVFDLMVPEIFHERKSRKKNEQASQEVAEMPNEDAQNNNAAETEVNTRKGYYPDDVANTFGVPVERHRADTEIQQMDGYISVGILTGERK